MRKQVDQVNQRISSHPSQAGGEVLETMHAIMHLYRSQQHRSLREGQHDLAHMEAKVLGFFARHPDSTPSDLVAHSGRDKAQVARLIRGLRERGLLEAQADELDRRSTRLSLSDQGRELYTALHRNDGKLAEVAMSGMSEAERSTLLDLLGRLRANLEAGQD
jgi:DNA-binding MarR family transcriptional regulator